MKTATAPIPSERIEGRQKPSSMKRRLGRVQFWPRRVGYGAPHQDVPLGNAHMRDAPGH